MNRLVLISLASAVALIAIALSASTTAVAQQNQPVTCVKRTASAKPPPFPAGPRPQPKGEKRSGRPDVARQQPLLQPLCPEGEVPLVKEFRRIKGNPLLAPERRSGVPAQRKILRNFHDVYGARGGHKPPPPPGPPPCDGYWNNGSCFYYGTAGLIRTADGGGMTTAIQRPQYVNTGGVGHSLNEIAVQGGTNNGDIVELGWLVSSEQYGDSDPHIFVFHWIGGVPQCYDGCNWQQYSNTYHPGQNVGALVGREVYNGYVFYEGNWWAWFDNQWLGYFPGSEWGGKFTKNALIQWFGEVASLNGIPPKTDMGTGTLPSSSNGAHMFTLCDVDAQAWICWYRDRQLLSRTVPAYYDVGGLGSGRRDTEGRGSSPAHVGAGEVIG